MLDAVIFMIEDNTQIHSANKCCSLLQKQNLQTGLLSASEISKLDRLNTLVVTDSSEVSEMLIAKNYFVIALLHEHNKEQTFKSVKYAVEDIEDLDVDYFEYIYCRYKKVPVTILQTKRCIVREISVDDVDALYRIYEEPSITKYMENLFEEKEKEVSYTKDYIENIYEFYGYGMWIVETIDGHEVIGRAGLEHRGEEKSIELGFMIAKAFQQQGYGYEVCNAIIQYAKEILGFDRIHCYVMKENTASIELVAKLGFDLEGTKGIDQIIYNVYVK